MVWFSVWHGSGARVGCLKGEGSASQARDIVKMSFGCFFTRSVSAHRYAFAMFDFRVLDDRPLLDRRHRRPLTVPRPTLAAVGAS